MYTISITYTQNTKPLTHITSHTQITTNNTLLNWSFNVYS